MFGNTILFLEMRGYSIKRYERVHIEVLRGDEAQGKNEVFFKKNEKKEIYNAKNT